MSVMDSALRESLTSLRLSGMLETLDARLIQAHGGELGHLDFLQVLCQDEITRRYTELSEALTRQGHHAVAGTPGDFICYLIRYRAVR